MSFHQDAKGLKQGDDVMTSPQAAKFEKYVLPQSTEQPSPAPPNWDVTKYYKTEFW